MKKLKAKLKMLTEDDLRLWLKYFLGMGLTLTVIVAVMSIFRGDAPLYVHGVVALEAGIFATLSYLIKKGKLFHQKG